MIWRCFVDDKLSPNAFIDGSVNTQVYINFLANTLLPFFDALSTDGIIDIVFQQDNATCHTSKKRRCSLRTQRESTSFPSWHGHQIHPI